VAELVLIVDDNELNLKLARDVLEAAGMRTLAATTAGDGLRLAREHRPDVVLLDLRLPDLDGTEALARLAADERTSGIPVLALSSLAEAEAGPSARAAGFLDYIEKPIAISGFAAQVRGHCGKR
jgi:two-component system cell cycle response regulator DivK